MDEACGEARVFDEYTHLDVALLAAEREVGRRDQRSRFVDDQAFGVEAHFGVWGHGPGVVVDVRVRISERPVLREELGRLVFIEA